MSDFVISARGLGKRYRIGEVESGIGILRRTLIRRTSREFAWAIRDLEFDVREGDALALIGRNGAGKSTLLKVLSRITEPTAGHVDIVGRVGALLEVGTGFHPQLTGRENVYLNGAILGMNRAEVRRKFDEIVEFSGVARHIDTPVKWYSSGMYVRLAFAVAAHLEPEILVVDEVLAVGDAEFQKRCIGRMSQIAREGRTVLFVSHNMQAVTRLCDRAILLDEGRMIAEGGVDEVVATYLSSVDSADAGRRRWENPLERPGNESLRLIEIRTTDDRGEPSTSFFTSKPIYVTMEIDLEEVSPSLNVAFDLVTPDGVPVLHSSFLDGEQTPALERGRNTLRCEVPPGLLNSGRYMVNLRISLQGSRWIVNQDSVLQFDAIANHGESLFTAATQRVGVVAPILEWSNEPVRTDVELPTANWSFPR
jgi:lipopolysaccharide transport system ATP-binding protein